MKMENVQEGILRMEHIYIKRFSFSRADKIEDIDLAVKITRSIEYLDDTVDRSQVTLSAKIFDEGEKLYLDMDIVGIFKLSTEEDVADLELKRILHSKNTITIMFPFLRSQISLLTAQPDLKPIILPTININSLFEDEMD